MIPKVTKGTRVRGLLEYLWGKGKADEHTNPHIVAGYDDASVLAPPRDPDDRARWLLADLAAKLDAPQEALGERGLEDYVLQVVLSVRSDEREIPDEEWHRIAHRYVALMGFAGDEQRAGCRWIAVHHGRSAGNNDHVHLVITRATEDGAPVYLRGEWRRSQEVCDLIEDEFGLTKGTPGRAGAIQRRALSRPELDEARRAGRDVTDREVLRREVRAALAGARDEADWVGRMKAAGLLVAARPDKADRSRTVGYAVALPPERRAGSKPRWLSGRVLDGELSLVRVRQRWPDGTPLSPAQWKTAAGREPVTLPGEARMEVWRRTAAAADDLAGRMAAVPADSPEWPAIARASADALAATAAVMEPAGTGPLSRAADILARAAAPRRRDPPPRDSAVARELGRVADALLLAGGARGSGELVAALAVVMAISRLVLVLAELRTAQQEAHAAGAAAASAAHLLGLLRQAQQAGVGAPNQGGAVSAERAAVRPAPPAPSMPPAAARVQRRDETER